MLNGWYEGKRVGSGSLVWQAHQLYAKKEINEETFMEMVAATAPSVGYCNTMGTASTMNFLAEVLGMQLPGSASIPAPHRDRGQISYRTGKKIVKLVNQNIQPSDIMKKESFFITIVVNSAIGGSTNAPIHLKAIASHLGIPLSNDEWQEYGYKIPLLVNVQPAGEYLSEDFYTAGGLPAVISHLLDKNLIPHPEVMMINGKTFAKNYANKPIILPEVIKTVDNPLKQKADFLNLKGNLFNSAIMKTSVISEEFQKRYLDKKDDPNAFEGRAIVFASTEEYHHKIDDSDLKIDEHCILFVQGAGPLGYPGGAEVVNMRPPNYLLNKGINALPCIGDGRQSGTSGSPSILNASPEAALNEGMAIVQTNNRIRIDLNKQSANILISEEEYQSRVEKLKAAGGFKVPESQTPWQEIIRDNVLQFDEGMVMQQATKYRDIANTKGIPRDSH